MTLRRLLTIAALTLAWCGLWQSISFANVASGLALAAVVTYSGLGTSGRGGVRPLPLLRLLRLVTVDLVVSTANVAIEILRPQDRTDEGIVAVKVPAESRQHLLILIVAVTVTPGTAVVDADPDTGTMYLHLLHIDRIDDTVDHVQKLAELACAALPLPRIGATA